MVQYSCTYATLPEHDALYGFITHLLELPLVAEPHFLVPLRSVTQVDVVVDQDLGVLGDVFGGSNTSNETEPGVLHNDPLGVGDVGVIDFVRESRAVVLQPHAVGRNVEVEVCVQGDPVVRVPEVLRVVRRGVQPDAVVKGHELLLGNVPLGEQALAPLLELGLANVYQVRLPRVGRRAVDSDGVLRRVLVAVDAAGRLGKRRDGHAVLFFETSDLAHARADEQLLVEVPPRGTG